MADHIVCIASEFKGTDFLTEAHNAGWDVTLVTRSSLAGEDWPRSVLAEVRTVPDDATDADYTRVITNIAGTRSVDRVVGLDEFDVINAAKVREYLQLAGMSSSQALKFRDKLAMRELASSKGISCPEFTGVFSPQAIDEFLDRVEPPWAVKPRFEVSAFGIRKCSTREQVWQVLRELDSRNTWRDHPSKFIIEKFIAGSVYHVDSIVYRGRPVAAGVSQYGTPPFDVTHGGGVFTSSVLPHHGRTRRELERLNRQLVKCFEYEQGIAHAEFLKSETDGKYYLLEIAARVGGAYIANVLEHASDFNLWREWARLETATPERPYRTPRSAGKYAGVALALANQTDPDISHYTDPEIVYRIRKSHHVGMIFCSPSERRIRALLTMYSEKITNDFLAVAPAKERYDD
jgi:biotin carboxylase